MRLNTAVRDDCLRLKPPGQIRLGDHRTLNRGSPSGLARIRGRCSGAKDSGTGWDALSTKFRTVASWFSDSTKYDFEVVAAGASGDLAYTVGYEHNDAKADGQPQTFSLRVTHVYRCEAGQWRIVRRHADILQAGDHPIAAPTSAAAETSSR
jgi:hypothetical protein